MLGKYTDFDALLKKDYRDLERFFNPDPTKGIVIFGASEQPGKLGTVMTLNIKESYTGRIFYINPGRPTIFNEPAYKTAKELPLVPDLAIVVTAADKVLGVIEQCADVGIHAAVVFAAGFQEMGAEGVALAEKVKEAAKRGGVRIVGPNCFGVFSKYFNGTFSRGIKADGGQIGIITQSGGIVCGPLDTVGKISRAASVGSMIDVRWDEMIRLFGDDSETKAILLYMEQVGDNAQEFIKAAREVGEKKLIVALKAGRTEGAAKAAASHTGSLAGDDKVFDEYCRLAGIVRADDIQEAEYLLAWASQPIPCGNQLVILTNGGGPVVLATDQLELHGGKLAKLSPETLAALDPYMPTTYSHTNPIDIIGDAPIERYRIAIKATLAEKNGNGVLITYVPVAMSDPTEVAKVIVEEVKKYPETPVAVSFTGTESVAEAKEICRNAGLAVYDSPDTAARIFAKLATKQKALCDEAKICRDSNICRNCPRLGKDCAETKNRADMLLRTIYDSGRTILTEYEAKNILGAYCIPVGQTHIAKSDEEAVKIAESMGYPVVLKLHSTTLTHKSDVDGVKLNLLNALDVTKAYFDIYFATSEHFEGVNVQKMVTLKGEEVLIGAKTDPGAGHVVAFGMGGTRAEFFKDVALTILPITTTKAEGLIKRTKISQILEKGWRGSKPADVAKLEDILVAFGYFLETHPEVKEVDINPLIVSASEIIALDARIILHKKEQ